MNCGVRRSGCGGVERGLPPTLASHCQERPDPKDWSLQDTDAFVLVYDICSPDSFDYVKALRQRISETRWERRRRCVSGTRGRLLPVQSGLCTRGVGGFFRRRGPGLRPLSLGRSPAVCGL